MAHLGFFSSKYLPPVLECEFKTGLGLEFQVFSGSVAFTEAFVLGGGRKGGLHALKFPPILLW